MEEIKINHPFWKTLLLAIGSLEIFALFIRLNGGFNLSEYGFLELLFFFGFGVVGLYFLLVLLKERFFGLPFMRITHNSLVVNRLFRKKVINFCDVNSFIDEKTVFDSTLLHIYYKQKKDSIKDSIYFWFIDISAHNLCNLLNRIRLMPGYSSKSLNNNQENRLHNLLEEYRHDDVQTVLYFTDSYTRFKSNFHGIFYTFFSLSVIIATAYALIHPDIVIDSALVSPFLLFLFVLVTFFLVFKVMPSLVSKFSSIVTDNSNSTHFPVRLGLSIISTSVLGLTLAYLFSEHEDSIKSKFYYHFSSNGICYALHKTGEKEAIITGATEGTSAIDIPEFVSYEDTKYPVKAIGKQAFLERDNLKSVVIGDSLMYISDDAFLFCSNLEYLKVKGGNPVYYSTDRCDAIIHKSSFRGKNYKNLIVGCANTIIPEDVTSIGECAFSGRVGMTSITIPSSVKTIRGSAFNSCYGLTSVIIPDSMESLGEYAFYNCKNLTSVVIPESMTSIWYMAFYECNSLTDVYCYAEGPPRSGTDRYHQEYPFDEKFIKEHTTLHVPVGSIERYKREAPWKYFKAIVTIY